MQEDIGSFAMKQYPLTFQNLLCAQFNCMGFVIPFSRVTPEADKGWAGEAINANTLKYMNKDALRKILPEWNKRYGAMRLLIDSCSNPDTNLVEIETRIKEITA